MTTTTEKLKALFARATNLVLVESFEATDNREGNEIPKVREWIMDELERRNPSAFAAWMDAPNSGTPRAFFA